MSFITCPCGQRLQQHEQLHELTYAISFTEDGQADELNNCPSCRASLYEHLINGALKPSA